MSASPLLSVKDLKVSFGRKKNQTEIIQGVSFDLKPNSILGLVGESGSGKSVTSLAIMGLLPAKTSQISGELSFEGQRLDQMNPKELRDLRGREISMIFQEPMTALNPSIRCGKQVAEVMKLHLGISSGEAKNRVISLFNQVQLPRPKSIYRSLLNPLRWISLSERSTSRAVVGSSATKSLGLQASAIAIITRCICPPLS
ncbi:hypothetical protein BST85_14040 [Aureitalea marina]|uniref:ABC transporter domain-containing protein n=1 Tax=Aureitalea marina TaxID=930804 RepID=A0A2S7KK21_9FLAO|nr:ATP-binding cassette domain-containing protein [Aureitalea marina]PQB02964.1 hypothetical protein BST85_14040 [Aureitalea marina]